MNRFVKIHGLGNEYIVLDSESINFEVTEEVIRNLCNVHYGIGSDGILLKIPSNKADFGLKIYNPDGSEAEKSGNGLRIFSKYIFDYQYTDKHDFSIETKGGIVKASIIEMHNNRAKTVKVDMGKAIFNCKDIPVNLERDICMDHRYVIDGKEFILNCVSVGNPHCVVIKENLDADEIKKYGPLIENNGIFPNRINVQFAKIIDRDNVEILIWERGAGFTLASGSSSCAVASVLLKKKLINSSVTIKMIGGNLKIYIDESWNIQMTGEVRQTIEGHISDEFFMDLITNQDLKTSARRADAPIGVDARVDFGEAESTSSPL